jgi:hypothetical protein
VARYLLFDKPIESDHLGLQRRLHAAARASPRTRRLGEQGGDPRGTPVPLRPLLSLLALLLHDLLQALAQPRRLLPQRLDQLVVRVSLVHHHLRANK